MFRLRAHDTDGPIGVLIDRFEPLLVRLAHAVSWHDLSVQQREVLLLAGGKTHAAIARMLNGHTHRSPTRRRVPPSTRDGGALPTGAGGAATMTMAEDLSRRNSTDDPAVRQGRKEESMNDPMKPLFTGERAKRFLCDTVVGCSEGALFVAISPLFGAAGLATFFETNRLAEDAVEMAAAPSTSPSMAATPMRQTDVAAANANPTTRDGAEGAAWVVSLR